MHKNKYFGGQKGRLKYYYIDRYKGRRKRTYKNIKKKYKGKKKDKNVHKQTKGQQNSGHKVRL